MRLYVEYIGSSWWPFVFPGTEAVLGRQTRLHGEQWSPRSIHRLLVNDITVSRNHCRIEIAGGEVWAEDAGSASGIFVNGLRAGRSRLLPGDVLQVGQRQFRAWLGEPDDVEEPLRAEATGGETPAARLDELAGRSMALACLVATNPGIPAPLVRRLSACPVACVPRALATNPGLPGDLLFPLWNRFPDQMLENPLLPLQRIVDPTLSLLREGAALWLLGSGLASPDVVAALRSHPIEGVREAAAAASL